MSREKIKISFTRRDGKIEKLEGEFGFAVSVENTRETEHEIKASIEGSINKYTASVLVIRLLPALGITFDDLCLVAESHELGDAMYE